ncbi:hypothetical protein A4A49_39949 [Nicotiana attenuata]|uniref:RNase H type-1 domain-containing protein n=1 Tax=Nicotiana attenuata TaxID=49451 RepID=A0A1J6IA78_NICAT|nr:hypothetical protein A4A49_39949 [Nicotiana attenuata]
MVITRALEYLHYSNINCTKMDRPLTVATKWEPPDVQQLKLNIDGALKGRFEVSGIEGVIRDSNGDWVIGFSKTTNGPSHLYIELEAVCQGLELAASHQFSRLQIETDSAVIPQLMESNSSPLYNTPLYKCRYWLKMLGSPPILHNFRKDNNIAHKLAQQGAQQANSNQIYLEASDYLKQDVGMDKEGITVIRTTITTVLNNLAMLGNPVMTSFGSTSTPTNIPQFASNGRTRLCNRVT